MPSHFQGPAGPPRDRGWHHVTERAATDPAFRRALLADPARALRETLGITLPAGYRVRFVERPADLDALIVLPDPREADELTDDELEQAAGGDGTWSDPTQPPPTGTGTTSAP